MNLKHTSSMAHLLAPKINSHKRKGAKNQDGKIEDIITWEESPKESPVITNISVPVET